MPKINHRLVYLIGIALLVTGLPLSMFLLSVAQIVLLVNWLWEGRFNEKFRIFKHHRSILAFVLIYAIHLAGMVYSTDWTYGLHDLRIKLPLLILPIIIGTSDLLTRKHFIYILGIFAGAVFISTIISTGVLFNWWGDPVSDVRDISVFISHIRLSLMINLAIFCLLWFLFHQTWNYRSFVFILLILWFVIFLLILKSLTGLVILSILAVFFSIRWILAQHNLMLKWFGLIGLVTVMLLSLMYLANCISRFNTFDRMDIAALEKVTRKGNPYTHIIEWKDVENGHFTWLYICEPEMKSAWEKRSVLPYNGMDLKQQQLKFTLIRYLSSKNLRKDEEGVNALSESDIRNIESGISNYLFAGKWSLYPRIYQLLWEIYQYRNGGDPSGHSFTQRYEYLKTAVHIVKNNFWFGVGTGDVAKAFSNQYVHDKSVLKNIWRLRAHNQFLTFWISFGIIGLFFIGIALFYPITAEKQWRNFFVVLFMLIGSISFLNEDTLETHAGVSFFAFFYAFFLYNPFNKLLDEEQA